MKILQLIAVMLLLSLSSCNSKPKAVPKQPCPDCCGTRYTDTIFCTNSSVMSPSEISRDLKYRNRFVGTHFWNPGHLIPLVEVVRTDATDDETANTVMEFMELLMLFL